MKEKILLLRKKKSAKMLAGGADRIEKHHKAGKLTAMERLNILFDEDTFCEIGALVNHRCNNFGMSEKHFDGDGVITGFGKVDGRLVYAYAQDSTVFGGSIGDAHGRKIAHIIDMATKAGAPVIGLNDSGGARIQEGVEALWGAGEIFGSNVRASGRIPQINAMMGPCAGGAVYSPALGDFIFMVENSGYMFLTGKRVVGSVSSEQTTDEQLGGAQIHSEKSGVAQFTDPDEVTCIEHIKRLLSYLPSNAWTKAPEVKVESPAKIVKDIASILPEKDTRCYDMYEMINEIADYGSVMPVAENFAKNIITAFARIDGKSVGIIANQPKFLAGCIDCDAADKAARFIRFCDSFNIPLLTVVDTPGFMPGVNQEYAGIIRHGAKILYAYSEASVPKITLILRRAYGGAGMAMCSKCLGADMIFAWPSAEIAAMGPREAAEIIFRKSSEEIIQQKRDEYKNKFENPYVAASLGMIDDVIEPDDTRAIIRSAFASMEYRPINNNVHGNMPV